MSVNTITLGLTGASGAAYGLRLLECLLRADRQVYLLLSKAAHMVLETEADLPLASAPAKAREQLGAALNAPTGRLTVFAREDWSASIASGSAAADAMVICPCSSGTLSAVATGASNNLLERAADVMLKERRQLILVHRETPLSVIHLENMLKLAQLGVTILPANPGFYHKPQCVADVVDFIVARVLDHLRVEHSLLPRWGAETPAQGEKG